MAPELRPLSAPEIRKALKVPLYLTRISAGSFSPADDYLEKRLDLNEYLIRHEAATFCFRVTGDSMTGAGIFSGDLLVVDRALKAQNGAVIVAKLGGDLVCKRLKLVKGKVFLAPENPAYPTLEITPDMEGFEVCGVVTHNIHSHGARS
ncbi:MAG TPA: translesion error-prone DNA polymerase V autoproteolytic subunit [bacterium]|nr:translesion error-prone DNA polymerase V autoproteolytic subunit [bacterium]